jgi:hypothetical protein
MKRRSWRMPTRVKRWTAEQIADRLFYLIERINDLESRIKELEGNGIEDNNGEPDSVAKILHIPHR